MVVEDLMQNTNFPFINWVMRFPLPEKFKVPMCRQIWWEWRSDWSYGGFQAHLILHGTPDEIACDLKGGKNQKEDLIPVSALDRTDAAIEPSVMRTSASALEPKRQRSSACHAHLRSLHSPSTIAFIAGPWEYGAVECTEHTRFALECTWCDRAHLL